MASLAFSADGLVLWKDDALLVVNKPAGLPTLVDGYDSQAPYLLGVLKGAYNPLWVVHRLDRQTSGVIVFARTAEAHRSLNTQFEKHAASKTYHALVTGQPGWDEKTVKLPLRPDGDRRHRTVVDPRQGKPAETHLRLLERFKSHALVEAIPRTGRTHQIRVHLAALGHPIIADPLYGDGHSLSLSDITTGYKVEKLPSRPLLERLGLHAWSLDLAHPVTAQALHFEAPYPKDFTAALHQLRKFSH